MDGDPSFTSEPSSAEGTSWRRLLASSLNNIAASHHSLGRRGPALRFYQKAVRARMDALRDDADADADADVNVNVPTTAQRAMAAVGDDSDGYGVGGDVTGVGVGPKSTPEARYERRVEAALVEEERLAIRQRRREMGFAQAGGGAVEAFVEFLDLFVNGCEASSEEEPAVVIKAEPIRIDHGGGRSEPGDSGGAAGGGGRGRGRGVGAEIDSRDSAITLFNMACCHLQSGSNEKSSALFDMALSVVSTKREPGLAALILHGVALLQYSEGKMAKAMQTSANAMGLLRFALESETVDIDSTSSVVHVEKCAASNLSLMARIHYTVGDPMQALDLCQEVLRLKRSTLGDDHIDTYCALYNVGLALERCGMLDDATAHCRCFAARVVGLISKELGDGSARLSLTAKAQIGTALFTSGLMHLQNHLVTPGIRLLKQSLSVRKSVFGSHNVLVADTMYRLGEITSDIGEYSEALRYYKESIRIYQTTQGPFSENAAGVLCSMGQLYHARGELDEALVVYSDVLSIVATLYGPEEEFVAQMEGTIGNIYLEKGETLVAMRRFANATRIMHQIQVRHANSSPLASEIVVVPMLLKSFGIFSHPCAAAA